MSKKILISGFCIILAVLAIFTVYAYEIGLFTNALQNADDTSATKPDVMVHWQEHPEVPLEERDDFIETVEDAIYNKQMAIEIGKIILEEYFPEEINNKQHKMQFDAEEADGIWKVYALPKQPKDASSFGGGVYVKLRKSGEVVRIGILD